ncbi:MAG: VanZ family protein [Candidatus Gastranaerophilales bacterium]|nr:VanZ family protein [Candidatus Gastranaerophilales bacterium]
MKIRNKRRKQAVTLLAVLLLSLLYCIIFSFSAQDGEESGGLSRRVSEWCVEFVNVVADRQWSQEAVSDIAAYWEHPIRKMAHFSEYACMGVLVYVMWRPWRERGRRLYALTILWVLVSAAGDEFHQLFVPDRCGSFADVLLDTCGGVFGLLFCIVVEKIVHGRGR